MPESVVYDLDLFRQLNAEYRDRPLVASPRRTTPVSLDRQAKRRAENLDRRLGLRGKRVLEIGCGRGQLSAVLAQDYDCEVVGVDIVEYESWAELASSPGVTLLVHDVTSESNESLGKFDRILSLAVFEHVRRPYEGLDAIAELLGPDGRAYVSANLYRGPKASHRYREVYFPFPHLLFDDDVFAQFYAPTRHRHTGPAWVNKLTAAQYRERVRSIGLAIEQEWTDRTPLDREFYERFSDKLARYPIEDLETDFIHLVLGHAGCAADASWSIDTALERAKSVAHRVGERLARR